MKKIKYFMGGEWKHRALQELLGDEYDCEKEIIWEGKSGIKIVGHADAVHKQTGVVVEFKTTESTKVTQAPYIHHVNQTSAYMSILNAQYGKILYMVLGYPRASQIETYFPEYLITFDYANQKREILDKLERDALELQAGIDAKDPSMVGHIARENMYLRYGHNWMCADCPFETH
jgi:hypothetical protein